MSLIDSIIIATGVLDLLLAFVVFARNSKSNINISFSIFSFFLGVWAFSIAFFRTLDGPINELFWAKSIYISGSFIAAALLYFANTFPEGKALSAKNKALIIIPSILHAAVLLYPNYLTRAIVEREWGREVILGAPEYLIYSIYFIAFFYGALYILWSKYKKFTGLMRTQVSFVLLSILIAGSIASIFDLFLPWFGNYQLIYIGPAFSGVIFWLITYAIFKHKLWDFKLVIVRSIAYLLLVTWIIFIYTGTVFWTSSYFFDGVANGNQIIVHAVLAIFVAVTFQPLKKLLEEATDSIFFRGKYNTSELLSKLSSILATTILLDRITENTLKELMNTMHISRGTFIIFDDEKLYFKYSEGQKEERIYPYSDVKTLTHSKKVLVLEEERNEPTIQIMKNLDAVVVLPLYVGVTFHGVVLLGEKKSGEIYSEEDVKVLEIFGSEASVAVENSKAYEKIRRFNDTLESKVEHATQNLRNANERLKQLDHLKDEFVSIASHELRTPMTVIRSYLWMILEGKAGKVTTKQKDYLEKAFATSDRLILLVNDMLNTSRIESGRMTINKIETDMEKLVEKVLSGLSLKAKETQIDLTFEKSVKKIPQIYADPEKIEQVLINLIGNSMKFTPENGNITIAAKDNSSELTVCVTDTGIGIKKEDMDKLFTKFASLGEDFKVRTNVQSTGLGLYLSKSIIELHGGRMWAESEGEGKGSRFYFTLPFKK